MKMKYVSFVLMLVCLFSGAFFYGCGDKYSNLEIELSETNLEFDLDALDSETTKSVQATLKGWSGDMLPDLIAEVSDVNVAAVSVGEADNNVSQLSITALGAGETTLTLKAKESSLVKVSTIKIVVNKAPDSIAPVNKHFSVKKGESLTLSAEEMLIISPNRVYPLKASFSLLPTKNEVNRGDYTPERKEELISLWNDEYGQDKLRGASIVGNELFISEDADTGIVQILAKVGECECSFGVLVYESDFEMVQINKSGDNFTLGDTIKQKSELEEGEFSIQLTTNESTQSILVGILNKSACNFRLEELNESSQILEFLQDSKLLANKTYTTFAINKVYSGQTDIKLTVDLIYNNSVFVSLEYVYSVVVNQDVENVQFVSKSTPVKVTEEIDEETQEIDCYPILTNYTASVVGTDFKISILPLATEIIEPMFSLQIQADETEKSKIHIYTDISNFVGQRESNRIVGYDISSAPKLKNNSTILVNVDSGFDVGHRFNVVIHAVMQNPMGFTTGTKRIINCVVVDAVGAMNIVSVNGETLPSNDRNVKFCTDSSVTGENEKEIVFSAVTKDKNAQFAYEFDSSVISVSEVEDSRTLVDDNQILTVKLKVKAIGEGETKLNILALSGESTFVTCRCYLKVVPLDFSLSVMDQYKSMLDNISTGESGELSLSMLLEEGTNKRVGIAYNVAVPSNNNYTYKCESVTLEGGLYAGELDTSKLNSNHYFVFEPNLARQNTSCTLLVRFSYVNFAEGDGWQTDSFTKKVVIKINAPLVELKWIRLDNNSIFDLNQSVVTQKLYASSELSYKNKELSTASLLFAADRSVGEFEVLDNLNLEGVAPVGDDDESEGVDGAAADNDDGEGGGEPVDNPDETSGPYSVEILKLCDADEKQLGDFNRYLYWELKITLNAPSEDDIVLNLKVKNETLPSIDCVIKPQNVVLVENIKVTNCEGYNNLESVEFGEVALNIKETIDPDNQEATIKVGEIFNPIVSVSSQFGTPTLRDFGFFIDSENLVIEVKEDEDGVFLGWIAKTAGVVDVYVYPLDRVKDAEELDTISKSKFVNEENPESDGLFPYFLVRITVCDGSEDYPYQIYSSGEFLAITDLGLDKYYRLMTDIDLAGSSFAGFSSFSGSIATRDNQHFGINGLKNIVSTKDDSTFVGVFSELTGATIENITFNFRDYANSLTVKTNLYYGLIAGKIADSTLTSVKVEFENKATRVELNVAGFSYVYVGAIAGNVTSESSKQLNVTTQANFVINNATMQVFVGGMFGYVGTNVIVLSNLQETNEVNLEINSASVNTSSCVGGLVGKLEGSIVDANVVGEISAPQLDNVGGVVGSSLGNIGRTMTSEIDSQTVPMSISSGVLVKGHDNVGGLIGFNNGNVTYSKVVNYVYNSVDTYAIAEGQSNVGGLIGQHVRGSVTVSYVMSFTNVDEPFTRPSDDPNGYHGDVIGNENVGGMVGFAETIECSQVFANVNIQLLGGDGTKVGGLFGSLGGSVSLAYVNCRILAPVLIEIDEDTHETNYSYSAKIGQLAGFFDDDDLTNIYTYVFIPEVTKDIIPNLFGEGSTESTTTYYFGTESAGQVKTYEDLKSIFNLDTTNWFQQSDDSTLNDKLPLLMVDGKKLITIPVTRIDIEFKHPISSQLAGVSIYESEGEDLGFVIDLASMGDKTLDLEDDICDIIVYDIGADKSLITTSSNENVISTQDITLENDGVIEVHHKLTAVGVGRATITLTSVTNRYVYNSFEINVINSLGLKVKVNSADVGENGNVFVESNETHMVQGVFIDGAQEVVYPNSGFAYVVSHYDENTGVWVAEETFSSESILPCVVNVGDAGDNKKVTVSPYWTLSFGGKSYHYVGSALNEVVLLKPYNPTRYNISLSQAEPMSGEHVTLVVEVENANLAMNYNLGEFDEEDNPIIYDVTLTNAFAYETISDTNVIIIKNIEGNVYTFDISLPDNLRDLAESKSFVFEFELTNQFTHECVKVNGANPSVEITFSPADVNKLNLSFYTKGINDYLKGTVLSSTSVSATEQGMLVIDVVQNFADFDYAIVEPVENGTYVSLQQIVIEPNNGSNPTIHNLENPDLSFVRLGRYSEIVGGRFSSFNGVMFVRVLISNVLREGDRVPLRVTLYKEDGKIMATKVIELYANFVSLATVEMSDEFKSEFSLGKNVVGAGTEVKFLINGEFKNCKLDRVEVINDGGADFIGRPSDYFDTSLTKFYYRFEPTFDLNSIGSSNKITLTNVPFYLYIGPDVNLGKFKLRVIFQQMDEFDNSPLHVAYENTVEGKSKNFDDGGLEFYVVDSCVSGFEIVNVDSGEEKALENATLPVTVGEGKLLKVKINRFNQADYETYKNYVVTNFASVDSFNAKLSSITDVENDLSSVLISDNTKLPAKWYLTDLNGFDMELRAGNTYTDFDLRNESNRYVLYGKNNVTALNFKSKFNFVYDNYRLKISNSATGDLGGKTVEVPFKINITGGINVNDMPEPIKGSSDLRQMRDGGNYILANDITLEDNWIPLSLANYKLCLDGNGYVITINSFGANLNNQTNVGLFSEIGPNVMIKHLILAISTNKVDLQNLNNANFGFFVGVNNGLIYNCEVVVTQNGNLGNFAAIESRNNDFTYAKDIVSNANFNSFTQTQASFAVLTANSVMANVGGFVGVNNGYITNCRVGKIGELTTQSSSYYHQTSQGINIFGAGNVGGFVGVNNKTISNSYFANGLVVNYSDSVRVNSSTGGFVAVQNENAIINGCYTQGRWTATTTPQSDIDGIFSQSSVGGFVHTCDGLIINSYASIRIFERVSMGGFVFSIGEHGKLENCYSSCLIDESVNNSGNFIGVNTTNKLQKDAKAELINCFYYTNLNKPNPMQSMYATPISTLEWQDKFGNSFVGFTFSQDDHESTWYYDVNHTYRGPQLTLANKVFYSHRNVSQFNVYDPDCLPGKSVNPLLITNFSDENSFYSWNFVFDSNATVVDGKLTLPKDVYLSLLCDVQFNSVTNSFDTAFKGVLYGNGYSINGFSYNLNESHRQNFGLFDTVVDGKIHNLTIEVSEHGISTSDVDNVGVLAGVICGDSFIENVKIIGKGVITGPKIVGGLAAEVSGNSYIQNVTVENITLSSSSTNKDIAYVGGVIGKLDLTIAPSTLPRIYNLTTKGIIILSGPCVGGVIGYVGESSDVDNISVIVEKSSSSRLSTVNNGVIGGVVGRLNGGKVTRAHIGDNLVIQNERDNQGNILGNSTLFNLSENCIAGGLVGELIGGKLSYSYARIEIPTATGEGKVVGAIIGSLTTANINQVYGVTTRENAVGNKQNIEVSEIKIISNVSDAHFGGYSTDKWSVDNFGNVTNGYIFPVLKPNYAYTKTTVSSFGELLDALENANANTIIKLDGDIEIGVADWALLGSNKNVSSYLGKVVTGMVDGLYEDNGVIKQAQISISGISLENFNSLFGNVSNFATSNVDFVFSFTTTQLNLDNFGLLALTANNTKFLNNCVTLNSSITVIQQTGNFTVGGLIASGENITLENITLNGDQEINALISTKPTNNWSIGGLVGFVNASGYLNVNNANLSHLTLKVGNSAATTLESSNLYLGGVVGYADRVVISSAKLPQLVQLTCDNYTSSVSSYVGGLVGFSGYNSLIENIQSNSSEVKVLGSNGELNILYVGGLAGKTNGELNNANSNVNVSVGSESNQLSNVETLLVGGIAGAMQPNYISRSHVDVNNCSYNGNILIEVIKVNNSLNVGGAIGKFELNKNLSQEISVGISNVAVTGGINLNAMTQKAYVGGVVGIAQQAAVSSMSNFCVIENIQFTNSLNANVRLLENGESYVGGLVGRSFALIRSSISDGAIVAALSESTNEVSHIGGIAGSQFGLHDNNSSGSSLSVSGPATIKHMYGVIEPEFDKLKNVTEFVISRNTPASQQIEGEIELEAAQIKELGFDYYFDLLDEDGLISDDVKVYLSDTQLRIVTDKNVNKYENMGVDLDFVISRLFTNAVSLI